MSITLDLAADMANSGKVLGALSLLLRTSHSRPEVHYVTADLLLGRLSVEDFESWAQFQGLLLNHFDKALADSRIDPARLLDHWVASVREKGLGVAPPFFLLRLREGFSANMDSALRSFAGATLMLLESGDQPLPSPLESFNLAIPDLILLMKRFQEARRPHSARELAELRLRMGNGGGIWDYYWYSQILVSLGQRDAAFDAQCQFVRVALQAKEIKSARNGVSKAMELIPFCRQMKLRVAQLRELIAGHIAFDEELRRFEKLIEDITMFRTQARASDTVCVGRQFYQAIDLQGVEGDLQRELRLKPSPAVYYEIAKIAALRGDAESAHEHLLTSVSLDTQFFDRVTLHA